MSPGIRATVAFTTPDICPIVELSETAETTIDSVSANICPSDRLASTVEFSVETDDDLDSDGTPVFSHGSTDRYRLTLDEETNCPCRCLAQFGCPVTRYTAEDGTLTLVFHAAEYDQLREIVAELRELFPEMDIRRFVRAPVEEQSRDPVFVQRTSHGSGIENPRRSALTMTRSCATVFDSSQRVRVSRPLRWTLDRWSAKRSSQPSTVNWRPTSRARIHDVSTVPYLSACVASSPKLVAATRAPA